MTDVRSVRLSRRRLLVDGKPELVVAGEVHYFRLHRKDWADRLDRLAEAGCTAVATYMPWLVHELPDGSVDLDGRTSEYRDLAGFLDLAAERGLLVIARPGPFVMAEMKNEGIPYRVHDEHPALHPVGWDSVPVPTRSVDYLAPDFLTEVERWYGAIMPLIASRLVTRGGPIAAVQLDNEIGMLACVTGIPDLTDVVLDDFAAWSRDSLGVEDPVARYGLDRADAVAWRTGVRTPSGPGSLALHHDMSDYQRDRYARYVAFLRETAESHGVEDIPFLINIHCPSRARRRTYPLGISQLYRSYRGQPQMTSGSDHYVGDLTVENVAELYTGNAYMAAVHDDDQPLTSVEFEAGLGDYGEELSRMVPPAALALKTRLFVAQGNRLINYYLFAGGHNPPLDRPVGDGNDRIAFTGEYHGFTAPIGPEGEPNPSYPALRETVAAVSGAGPLLADMDEEYDDVALAFVPDHYLTEYCHPEDKERRAVVADLEQFRGTGSRDIPGRAMLLGGFSFPAVDLQSEWDTDRAIVLGSPTTLAADVQRKLASWVLRGGRLLLAGVLPQRDIDGSACTILADTLGLRAGLRSDHSRDTFPSVRATGWAPARAEVRTEALQHLSAVGDTDIDVFAVDAASGEPVGVEVRPGTGHVLVLSADYPCHLDFWTALLARLGVRPRHTHDATAPGTVVTSTVDAAGQRLLHLLNLSPFDQTLVVRRDGEPLLGDTSVHLPARSGRMLPLELRLDGGGTLAWSTCELAGTEAGLVLLRRTGTGDAALVVDPRDTANPGGTLHSWPDDPTACGQVVRIEVPVG
ncbi:beta-galactosidase [Streptomyces luteolus]|uniref:Beta-galactosidase n=1 Tax=Streptomyces luteolus TaxID=3043615 RepID=A0ABT6SSY7_9ACTN|nr:beta-galactosidase [Streptomyces sp. B-S-A12]MDI3418727.1 beta-galactosidase [Streptomyces sp. B-S-A12]